MFTTLPLAATLILSMASSSVMALPSGGGHHAAASLTSLSHLPIDLTAGDRRAITDEVTSKEDFDRRYYGDSRNLTAPRPLPEKRALSLPAGWSSVGCLNEGTNGRAIVGASYSSGSVTVESCLNYCLNAGYTVAGVEYGDECYCGNSYTSNSGGASSTGCSYSCAGDSSETCGGWYALSTYSYSGSSCATTSATASAVASASATTTSSAAAATATATSENTEWESLGCFYDNPADNNGKNILTGYSLTDSASMTTETCQSLCDSKGYNFAGTEYGTECWCGDLTSAEVSSLKDNAPWCNMACSGKSSETCGGGWSLQLYELVDVGDC